MAKFPKFPKNSVFSEEIEHKSLTSMTKKMNGMKAELNKEIVNTRYAKNETKNLIQGFVNQLKHQHIRRIETWSHLRDTWKENSFDAVTNWYSKTKKSLNYLVKCFKVRDIKQMSTTARQKLESYFMFSNYLGEDADHFSEEGRLYNVFMSQLSKYDNGAEILMKMANSGYSIQDIYDWAMKGKTTNSTFYDDLATDIEDWVDTMISVNWKP